MISKSAVIHPHVTLGKNCIVEDFAIVGALPRDCASGDLETVIGDDAVIRSHTVIYAGNRIGDRFQTGNKANIRESNQIGDDVSIGTLTVVEFCVMIGNRVRMHSQAFVPEFSVLEDDCWIGPNVVLTNAKYPQSPLAKEQRIGPTIGRGAVICANVTLLPGISIGPEALVGAGSVVTRDVPGRQVVVGNPARVLKAVEDLPNRMPPVRGVA